MAKNPEKNKNVEPHDPEPTDVPAYEPKADEQKVWTQFRERKRELMTSRKNVYGMDIDQRMREWDRKYFDRVADIPPSELDMDQRPIAINNAFGKVQSALSLLIENNPDITLQPGNKRSVYNKQLIKSLAKKSWQRTDSLQQFELFVFNMAKRGWAVGRTFHRKLDHKAKFPDHIDEKTKKVVYEEHVARKMDDIAFVNLDNHNVWIDEEARPGDMYSIRDWMWREIWHIDKVRQIFPVDEFPNMKFVKEGGDTRERIEEVNQDPNQVQNTPRQLKKHLTEIFFYENQYDDKFIVEVNGTMVVWEPLPQWSKRISLVTSLWNLRSAEDIYGVGILELMEKDENLCDRILNMEMRQLLLSINPPGFYSGTEDYEDENLRLRAGIMRKVLDPQAIRFLEIPPAGPGSENMIARLEKKEDSRTGITPLVEGDIPVKTGGSGSKAKTNSEYLVSREAGLRKLQIPKRHLSYALKWEFMNRIALIQQVYSDFEVEELKDKETIFEYLQEVNADRDFFHIENEGKAGKEQFYAKRYREVPLAVEQDERGEFLESENERFFKIKPQWLPWEGDVIPDVNMMLTNSEEMESSKTLQLANMLLPLFQLPPQVIPSVLKPAKQMVLAFNKDPEKWFPDTWVDMLHNPEKMKQQQKDQAAGQGGGQGADPNAQPAAGGGGDIQAQKANTQVAPKANKPVGVFTKILKSMNIGGSQK